MNFSQRLAPPKRPGFVYLIRADNGVYKIGKTKLLGPRVNWLAVNLPYSIKVIHVIKTQDMDDMERWLHAQFQDKRLGGEWFDLDDAEVEHIKGIRDPS